MNHFGSLFFVLYLLILAIQSLSLNSFADFFLFFHWEILWESDMSNETWHKPSWDYKIYLVLISQRGSWVQDHVRHFCLLRQDLIGSSAALCENMGHTYSSMGNYDEAPNDADRYSTTEESVSLLTQCLSDYRIARCFSCIAFRCEIGEKSKHRSVVQRYVYKLTCKLTKTQEQYCVCVVLCFGCSCQAMRRLQSTFSGLWNVWIKRLARRPEIGQVTAPEPSALHSTRWKMMEDGGTWWRYVFLVLLLTRIGSNWLLDFRQIWRVMWTRHSNGNKARDK